MGNEVKDYLNDYCDFVTKVTSEPSLDQKALFERMEEIETSHSCSWFRQRGRRIC